MIRIIISLPPGLLAAVDRARPAGQDRTEWIREAIRRRLDMEQRRALLTQEPRKEQP